MPPTLRAVRAMLLGSAFRFETLPGLFSADRIDDGTRLLLEHLPATPPRHFLDMGCGYGALGLPVAARFPHAAATLVDRNTVATTTAQRNALAHGLGNVRVHPSLGYRELGAARFDWILCNVPARIGDAALRYFFEEGARRLEANGMLRAVVIRDLAGPIEAAAQAFAWPLRRVAEGARHLVYTLSPFTPTGQSLDHETVYLRDRVRIGDLELERPADVSEEPDHLRDALPLLFELLPRTAPASCLVWRGGYGAMAVELARRGGQVFAADPDLLTTTFTRRNAQRAGIVLETREGSTLRGLFASDRRFGLVVGELPSAASAKELTDEVRTSSSMAAMPGGTVLWLGRTKSGRTLMKAAAPLARRGAFTVWRTPSSGA